MNDRHISSCPFKSQVDVYCILYKHEQISVQYCVYICKQIAYKTFSRPFLSLHSLSSYKHIAMIVLLCIYPCLKEKSLQSSMCTTVMRDKRNNCTWT